MNISDVSRLTGFKPHTLRYYESIGLIEPIDKSTAGIRCYTEKDIIWLTFLKRLKATGMPIKKMLEYARLRQIGDSTASARKQILIEHHQSIEERLKILIETKEYVEGKIKYYEELEEEYTCKTTPEEP